MKNLLTTISFIACVFAMTSCGVSSALVINQNQNATQVQLGSNNFKTVQNVTGNAQVRCICLVAG